MAEASEAGVTTQGEDNDKETADNPAEVFRPIESPEYQKVKDHSLQVVTGEVIGCQRHADHITFEEISPVKEEDKGHFSTNHDQLIFVDQHGSKRLGVNSADNREALKEAGYTEKFINIPPIDEGAFVLKLSFDVNRLIFLEKEKEAK